jgi:site-specific recombinase XerD
MTAIDDRHAAAAAADDGGFVKTSDVATPGAERIPAGDRVTIFRTAASPNWYMQYNLGGRQFKPSLKTTSKKRALQLAGKKDAQLVLGQAEPPAAAPITVTKAKDQYLATLAARGKSAKTRVGYRSKLDVFDAYCTAHGVRSLDRVTATFLEQYQQRLAEKGFVPPGPARSKRSPFKDRANRPRTVRDKMKIVRQLINWARKRGLLKADPAAGYELPPAVKQQAYCWTAAELARILGHAPEAVADLFHFLRLTGLRADEFCWLLKDDLVADPPHVKIRAKTCPQTGTPWRAKHGNERVVPLCPRALAIARAAVAASPGPWLFHAPDTHGRQPGPRQPSRLWRALKATMKLAGVKRGTTHTFRHVFCSFLVNRNVPAFQIMKVMGHDSLDIVLAYCHTTEDELIRTVTQVPFDQMLPAAAATATPPLTAATPGAAAAAAAAAAEGEVSM